MLKVLEVRPDGTAVVDATGLFRVVLQPGNEVADELLDEDEAKAWLSGFNRAGNKYRATAISYPNDSQPGWEIIDEFCTEREAKYILDFYKEIEPNTKVAAVPYGSSQ